MQDTLQNKWRKAWKIEPTQWVQEEVFIPI